MYKGGNMNTEMKMYYILVDLIDWYVTGCDKDNFIKLLELIESYGAGSPADVGDANDCGCCKSWEEVIEEIRKLHESGERIPI